jgi:DNA-binding NarL/FixJ family response regulator
MSIRVLLADDQELLRMGFRMILQAQPDLDIVGEAVDGADAVRQARRLEPDVVLMDVRMPGVDGIDATAEITAASPVRVLVLTTFDLDEYAFAALRAGASGFLLKDVPPDVLAGAIRAVAAGDAVVSPRITRQLLDRFSAHLPAPGAPPGPASGAAVLETLTDREREVFGEVARGHTNAEVAARLHLSEATVKTHLTRILAKLALRDRVQIVIFAYEHGLVDEWAADRE